MFDSISKKEVWLEAMRSLKKRDKTIGRVIDRIGYIRINRHSDYFGTLVRSIISQQISGAAAESIRKRLEEICGGRMPTPREYLHTSNKQLSSAGLSPQKISYIKDLSERILDGRVELKKFNRLPNETVINELDGVKGIGRWTAEMFLIFSLGRTDVLARDDLGIRNGIKRLYKLKKYPTKERFDKLERLWHPYSTVACIYLWEYGSVGV
ncbi:MAG: DNA-3-methyladenine glycosylase 2 family protein [Candidatus Parvarchaeota archaeon]|nr:DNA-3-methyladenine glycosylase 2 family protein [Candidatus Parvarchaeota archaeon]